MSGYIKPGTAEGGGKGKEPEANHKAVESGRYGVVTTHTNQALL